MLLTNKDSDNTGDQVIEICDIALIRAVEKNLHLSNFMFKINSRAAGIVTEKYLTTKAPEHLKRAENAIQAADLIVFGGAPMFNYLYQNFYEKTAAILALAEKYQKPVLFSAIGVERYDDDNKKCQSLKQALNLPCVKQITTRDGIEHLAKYRAREENFCIAKVSDPAVFTKRVFEKFLTDSKAKQSREKKKVGIFVLRANGFADNGYSFDRNRTALLWIELLKVLRERGYDCELVTSGNFGDEAFLEYMFRNYDGVALADCVFNINTPEALVKKISEYDGVISCRMHPSIVSFSLDVPSIGIEWNPKVKYFYDSIGYPQRVVQVEELSAELLADQIEAAMAEGVQKDSEYLVSVYQTLFTGIRDALRLEGTEEIQPYTCDELMEALSPFKGTSEKEKQQKLSRKFRRAYRLLNNRMDKLDEQKEKIAALESQVKALKKNVPTTKD